MAMNASAKKSRAETGIHYPLHMLNRYSLPELIGLAEHAIIGATLYTKIQIISS